MNKEMGRVRQPLLQRKNYAHANVTDNASAEIIEKVHLSGIVRPSELAMWLNAAASFYNVQGMPKRRWDAAETAMRKIERDAASLSVLLDRDCGFLPLDQDLALFARVREQLALLEETARARAASFKTQGETWKLIAEHDEPKRAPVFTVGPIDVLVGGTLPTIYDFLTRSQKPGGRPRFQIGGDLPSNRQAFVYLARKAVGLGVVTLDGIGKARERFNEGWPRDPRCPPVPLLAPFAGAFLAWWESILSSD